MPMDAMVTAVIETSLNQLLSLDKRSPGAAAQTGGQGCSSWSCASSSRSGLSSPSAGWMCWPAMRGGRCGPEPVAHRSRSAKDPSALTRYIRARRSWI